MPGILGLITHNRDAKKAQSQLNTMLSCMLHEPFYKSGTYLLREKGCYLGWVSHPNSYSDCNPVINATGDRILIFSGEHFEHHDARTPARYDSATTADLLTLYERQGKDFLLALNGSYAGVLVDLREGTVLLFNDRFGLHRIYYHEDKETFIFATEAKSILSICPDTRGLDPRGLGEFLGFGTVLDNRTLFRGISTLPAGSVWSFDGSAIIRRRYFNVNMWEEQPVLSEKDFYARLKATVSRIVPTYFRSRNRVGLSLTGGLDTRIIMAARPQLAEPTPCYTYGGIYRDCFDVFVARDVAEACGQPHHVVTLETDFFATFHRLAAETVWYTDGCLDICASHEIYFSRRVRELAPVRLIGTYGSEILRAHSSFKYTAPGEHLLAPEVVLYLREAVASFADLRKLHPLSFAVFKEVPWHLHGRPTAAASQLVVRSPFLDNELVSLMYQAPPEIRRSNKTALRLISALNPSLSRIESDMGYGGTGSALEVHLRQLLRYVMFKAEWYYAAGMPHGLSRLDHFAFVKALEPLFLGSHKIEHYRLWFRDQLSDYIQSMLSDRVTATRPYLNQKSYRHLVESHISHTRNYLTEINTLLTLELIQRLLIERDYKPLAHPNHPISSEQRPPEPRQRSLHGG
jgi:asparagine synthase (glutamine-hydrolysing)